MGRINTKIILLFIAALLILVLISLSQYGSSSAGFRYVREGYFFFHKAITSPVDVVSGLWSDYVDLVNTQQENIELKQKNDEMQIRCMNLEDLKSENERYRAMLGFKAAHKDFELIPASLLTQDITLVFKTAVIDRGRRNGFFTNMPIVSPEGVLGRVIDVTPHTSQVLLITDPNSSIPALIESSRIKGIVKGRGDGMLTLEYVRRTEDIHVGDCIITSSLLEIFPKGLKIGYINDIFKDERKLFSEIILTPCVDMEKIEGVFGISGNVADTD